MTMLGEKNTEVLTFADSGKFTDAYKEKGKIIPPAEKASIVRRRDTKETDFVTFFSKETKSVEKVPVSKTGGGAANAIGVKVTLKDGKVFQALVNYEPEGTEVVLGEVRTKERFATDYKQ